MNVFNRPVGHLTENQIRERRDLRGYEHASDSIYAKDKKHAYREVELDEEQRNLVNSLLPSSDQLKSGIETLSILAVSNRIRRQIHEEAALGLMGTDLCAPDSEYFRLAGNPDKIPKFIHWFDDLACSAMEKALSRSGPIEMDSYGRRAIIAGKAMGLELGSSLMLGDWSRADRLWTAVNSMSPALESEGLYTPGYPSSSVSIPSYEIKTATNGDFLSIIRERGVWDINTPNGDKIYVAHRQIGLIAVSSLKESLQVDIRHSQKQGKELDEKSLEEELGPRFENNIMNKHSENIIPESSTVFVRHSKKLVA